MNVVEMRQRVIAGPREHPGATIVEYEDGHQVSLVWHFVLSLNIFR